MNNNRRKTLKSLIKQLEEVYEKFENLKSDCEEISQAISDIRNEEEEAYDNLPEGIQESERGERMQEVIEHLESAIDEIDNVDIDDILSYLDSTTEAINNAIE